MIEPKILKGFRDSLPQQEIVRQRLISKVKEIFESYGFVPIDTPALEYTDVLLGKGGGETDKQMFRFTDNGGRDVALRFDLTVPLARFVALNYQTLSFPFKRYHISKVWRGEKPQKGRYREFWQCDFDIVGADNCTSDAEILCLIHSCLSSMGIGEFRIKVSHRGLFNRFLKNIGLSDKNDEVLRSVDKLGKIGIENVSECLAESGISEDKIKEIVKFISIPKENFEKTLEILHNTFCDAEEIIRLEEIGKILKDLGIQKNFIIDTSITRGLDYYTGVVFETELLSYPQIGSICSGGRYNNLAGLYTKENLPGVGSCIGLDRLMAALEETKNPIMTDSVFANVLVVKNMKSGFSSQIVAKILRDKGISADLYVGDKSSGAQFAYAEKNSIRYAVVDYDGSFFTVKKIDTREIINNLTVEDIVLRIKNAK